LFLVVIIQCEMCSAFTSQRRPKPFNGWAEKKEEK
jgi:hypothetical protein